ncbi:MAG: PIN domain-containing protein [Betaproteobacteria bacterium]
MVLADTSVWVEHLRRGEPRLAALLEAGEVLCHPFVVGELACGNLRNRGEILGLLAALPGLGKAGDEALLAFIARHELHGKGMGLVDIHLLTACALARWPIWTLDARLAKAATRLGLALD